MNKYIQLAKKLGMADAILIKPDDVFFDIRVILKCRWGCEYHYSNNLRCNSRDVSYTDQVAIVRSFRHILLVHANDKQAVSKATLEIERIAFLDGFYFASAIRVCNLCKECKIKKGEPCPTPDKIRPCDSGFGIDTFTTVKKLGLPINVLQDKTEVPNHYGYVMID